MTEISTLAAQAQEIAHKLGIPKFDIYGATIDDMNVQVDKGEPKQVKASNRSSVTVRAWNRDNTVGITSTTDVDGIGLELALKTAYEASAFGVRDHAPDFSPEAQAPVVEVPNGTAPQAPLAALIETLIGAENDLLHAHPAIVGVPYNGLSQRDIDRFYLNSEGAVRQEVRSYTSMYLYSKTTEEGGKKPRSAGAYRVSRSFDQLDIGGCLQEVTEKTLSHLNYEKIQTGKYQVVFSPEAFLSLVGAFSNLWNAQSILDKQSLSTPDSIGTQLAVPLLSICDDPLHPANLSAETFDGEGTPTRRVPIITEGALTGFLHSAGTAKRLNSQPTGHANTGAKVTVSSHFYHVLPGTTSDSTYNVNTADQVIWIDDLHALHAGVSALQGSFSLPFDGWLLKNGDRISIESATVAGDFLELLKAIVHVEPEVKFTPGGIAPRIWVEGLSITGE